MDKLLWLVLAAVAGTLLWWLSLDVAQPVSPQPVESVSQGATHESAPPPAQTTEEPLPTASEPESLPDGVQLGELAKVEYFNALELKSLGIEREATAVRYAADLNLNLLIKGKAYPHDNIASIDAPRFVDAATTDAWLDPGQLVIGVRHNGITRAYPHAILGWHEIVNDRFGDQPVVVTYCPLCLSSIVFAAPSLEGQPLTFGNSGRLYKADLVMYDRATATLWSQFEGRPIVGPLVGEANALVRIPADVVPWGIWRAMYPNTEVLDRPRVGDRLGGRVETREHADGFPRDYGEDPIAQYRTWNTPLGEADPFGNVFDDGRLQAKDEVIGVVVGLQAKAYLQLDILAQQLLNDVVGGVPLLVVVTPEWGVRFFERVPPGGEAALEFSFSEGQFVDDAGNAWDYDGAALEGPLLGTRLAQWAATPSFWFAWVAFHPDTELFIKE